MKNLNQKFSIITSIYNGDKFLTNYFDNIYKQTLKPHEVIIINDGNNIFLKNIIKKHIKNYPTILIKLINNKKNLGSKVSLNKGIAIAKTKILFRLDVDDIWHKNHTQICINMLRKNPNFSIYSEVSNLNFFQKITNDEYLVNRNTLIHSSWILNLNVLDSFRYSGKKNECEDYITLTKYIVNGAKIYYSKKNTVAHRHTINGHGIRYQKTINEARKKCSIKLFNYYKNKSSNIIFFIFIKFGFIPFLYFVYKNYIKK